MTPYYVGSWRRGDRVSMLALNITAGLKEELDDRPRDIQSCAQRWWAIADGTLSGYGDQVLAVANNVIIGVFDVRG